jgi:hypothetical protein
MIDRALGQSIDLNDTAKHIVYGIDGTRSVGEIASGLSQRFGVAERTALDDTTELIETLYRGGLVRARPPYRYRLAYLVVTLRTFDLSFLRGVVSARKRVDILGGGFLAIFAQVALRISFKYLWLAAYMVLIGGAPLLLLGGGAANALRPSFILAASGLLLTVHVLSLLPPSSDGKKLFSYAFAQLQTEEYHER